MARPRSESDISKLDIKSRRILPLALAGSLLVHGLASPQAQNSASYAAQEIGYFHKKIRDNLENRDISEVFEQLKGILSDSEIAKLRDDRKRSEEDKKCTNSGL